MLVFVECCRILNEMNKFVIVLIMFFLQTDGYVESALKVKHLWSGEYFKKIKTKWSLVAVILG